MIGRIRGEVIDRAGNTAVVDVGGVGYQLTVSAHAQIRLGERVDLFVHTHVREDALHLYGFRERLEREVFDMLITVPNVGPVKAMQILQTPVTDLVALVAKRDAKGLAKLPGVGKKTAERLLIDLADKLQGIGPVHGTMPAAATGFGDTQLERDLYSALVNLGFKDAVAAESTRRSIAKLGEDAGLEALLKDALSSRR
jgi:Holliday junction DNA helicase RuvA